MTLTELLKDRPPGASSQFWFADYQVQRCEEWVARPVIETEHYLEQWPHPKSLPFAYCLTVNGWTFCEDGLPYGVIVLKKPQHHKQKGLFGYPGLPTAWQVLDLARVWVHPWLQSTSWAGYDRKGEPVIKSLCIFSRMVSMVLKRVQRDWIDHHPPVYPEQPYHIELIISYCDREHHQGVGYRASGFTPFGETADRTKDVYFRRLKRPRWRYVSPQLRMDMEGGIK